MFEFNYANGDMTKNDENITRIQKDYIKQKFRKELIALGYEEDKPFFSFLAEDNLNRNVYTKDKSIMNYPALKDGVSLYYSKLLVADVHYQQTTIIPIRQQPFNSLPFDCSCYILTLF